MRSRADRSLPLRRLLLGDRNAVKYCLQYSFQYYHRDRDNHFGRGNMAVKPLKQAKASAAKSRQSAAAREVATAVLIARSIEEDIVLGRRLPRERLIEQDLC